MMFGFGSAFVGYLAAAGLATNAAVVGRGLVGSARLASQGRLAEAGARALAAVGVARRDGDDLGGRPGRRGGRCRVRAVRAGAAAGEASVAS
jgi:hypothetical protein